MTIPPDAEHAIPPEVCTDDSSRREEPKIAQDEILGPPCDQRAVPEGRREPIEKSRVSALVNSPSAPSSSTRPASAPGTAQTRVRQNRQEEPPNRPHNSDARTSPSLPTPASMFFGKRNCVTFASCLPNPRSGHESPQETHCSTKTAAKHRKLMTALAFHSRPLQYRAKPTSLKSKSERDSLPDSGSIQVRTPRFPHSDLHLVSSRIGPQLETTPGCFLQRCCQSFDNPENCNSIGQVAFSTSLRRTSPPRHQLRFQSGCSTYRTAELDASFACILQDSTVLHKPKKDFDDDDHSGGTARTRPR